MKFALLYHYDPEHAGPAEGEVSEWVAFDEKVRAAGAFVYEAGFHSASAARSLQVREGEATIGTGPVTDAGDTIAGLYVVEVADIESALDWARKIPTARYGKVEVRQIVEF